MTSKSKKELTAEIDALIKKIKQEESYWERGLVPREGRLTKRQIAQLEKRLMALKRQRGDYRPRHSPSDRAPMPAKVRAVVSGGLPTLGRRGK